MALRRGRRMDSSATTCRHGASPHRSPVADRARSEVMSTARGYRPASPERIAERIAWANAVALADDEDGAQRAVLLFAAEYADADDQFVIDNGGEPEINRRACAAQMILSNLQI